MTTKLRKLSLGLICLLIILVSTLSGCVFEVNPVKFYNAVVATVGTTEIKRSDLLYAYNSYGYEYYVGQGKLSQEKAIKKTLDAEIDKELLLQYCTKFSLTAEEEADIWKQVYDYMDGLLKGYEERANIALDKPTISDPEEETVDKDDKFKPYVRTTKRIKVIDNKTLQIIPKEKTNSGNTLTGWENYDTSMADAEVYEKCKQFLVSDLIKADEHLRDKDGKAYSKEAEKVMEKCATDAYDRQKKYALLQKLQTEYEEKTLYSATDIVGRYRELVTESYLKYYQDTASYKAAMSGEGATPDNVYYHPNNDYFYVDNLLLGFNAAQTAQIKVNAAMRDQGAWGNKEESEAEYKRRLQLLADEIVVKTRDKDGKYIGETTVESVMQEVTQIVVGSESTRSAAIMTLLDKYNTDPGMYNASMPYIDAKDNKAYVDEFNKAGVKLDEAGIYGKNSGLVLTDFGYHILFYGGKVNPVLKNSNLAYANMNALTVKDLDNTIINPITGQTMLDKLFDMIYPAKTDENVGNVDNGYSAYEQKLLDSLTNEVDVHINKSVRDSSLKKV